MSSSPEWPHAAPLPSGCSAAPAEGGTERFAARAARRHRRQAGFSLIEAIVAVVVLAVVVAMAMPRLSGLSPRARTQGALNQIAADVSYTRTLALRTRYSATMTINATSYTIVSRDSRGTRTIKTVNLATDYQGVQVLAAPTLPRTLNFNSSGLLTGQVSDLFIKAAGGGRRDSVLVSRTGRAYREW